MKAREIYDKIIQSTPKIDSSNEFKKYLTGQNYIRFTSKVRFEDLVWQMCKPDKCLANAVMRIAEDELKKV